LCLRKRNSLSLRLEFLGLNREDAKVGRKRKNSFRWPNP
jgi:hypothetical protein